MKRVFIIHGWGGSPNEPILKWLRESLIANDFEVIAPRMPNSDTPTIIGWVSHLVEIVKNPDEETILIGHSVGCQAIIRYLETLPEKIVVGKVILTAPWMIASDEDVDEDLELVKPWMETPIDFEKVKKHSKSFFGIFSDNDYSVPLVANENLLKDKLEAKTVVLKNKGHFTEADGISELPEVLEIINF